MKPNNIKNRIKSRLFNLQDIKCGSMSENEKTQITNPLNASVASNTGIRVKLKKFLEKVPILAPVLLWCWRLITLPSRFHRLSRHFEAEIQGINSFKSALTKMVGEGMVLTDTQSFQF